MDNRKFCFACGEGIDARAEICPKCGVRQQQPTQAYSGPMISERKLLPAFLLCFFFGFLGAHRFYAGKTGSGIAMLILSITVIGLIVSGIWSIIDCIILLCGNFRDNEGKLIKNWT